MSLQHAPPHTNLCFCWHFLSEIGLSCAGLAQPHSPHMCTFLCEVHPTAIAHHPSMLSSASSVRCGLCVLCFKTEKSLGEDESF